MKKNKKILLFILPLIWIWITYALNTYNTWYKIYEANDNSWKNYEIIDDLPESYEWEKKCIKITNFMNNSKTKAFFSPTKTKTEWNNFKSWCNNTTDCKIEYLNTSNLVLNWSFEIILDEKDPDNVANWYWDKNWSTSSTINPKPDWTHYAFTWWDWDWFYQDIDISSFSNWTNFKLDFYSGYNKCSWNNDNKIILYFLDSSKNIISSNSYNITDQVYPEDSWDYELEHWILYLNNKPSNAKYIRIKITAWLNCDSKVDNIILKQDTDWKCNFSTWWSSSWWWETTSTVSGIKDIEDNYTNPWEKVDNLDNISSNVNTSWNWKIEGTNNDYWDKYYFKPWIAWTVEVKLIKNSGSNISMKAWDSFNSDNFFRNTNYNNTKIETVHINWNQTFYLSIFDDSWTNNDIDYTLEINFIKD